MFTFTRFVLFIGILCLMTVSLHAAMPFDDYVNRIAQAAEQITKLANSETDEDSEKTALQTITELLPATEDIARGSDVVHVDNSWLHQAISNLDWDDDEIHVKQLNDIAARLKALERRLRESSGGVGSLENDRERLNRILAGEEYKTETQQDSIIRTWLRKISRAIDRFLLWLFTRNGPQSAPSGETVALLRYLILSVTAIAAVAALTIVLRRFKWQSLRKKVKEDEEPEREILGERIDSDLTPDDLLREAAEMARKGDFRMAIRRAYIALLFELEQRGKLKLHRAKTNNDYLHELKREDRSYLSVAQMTNRYERVWYGQNEATLEDYAGFIDRYREVASVR